MTLNEARRYAESCARHLDYNDTAPQSGDDLREAIKTIEQHAYARAVAERLMK